MARLEPIVFRAYLTSAADRVTPAAPRWQSGGFAVPAARKVVDALAALDPDLVPAGVVDALDKRDELHQASVRPIRDTSAAQTAQLAQALATGHADPAAVVTVTARDHAADTREQHKVLRKAAEQAYATAVKRLRRAAPGIYAELNTRAQALLDTPPKWGAAEQWDILHATAKALRDHGFVDTVKHASSIEWMFGNPDTVTNWLVAQPDTGIRYYGARPTGDLVNGRALHLQLVGITRGAGQARTFQAARLHRNEWEPGVVTADQVVANLAAVAARETPQAIAAMLQNPPRDAA